MYKYFQVVGGEEVWKPTPLTQVQQVVETQAPMFVTALAVNKLVEDLTPEQRDKLAYEGPFYVDWDGPDIATVLPKVHAFMDKLVEMHFDLSMAAWYLTGTKGFHLEIPAYCFIEKSPKGGIANLPVIYREMVMALYVDTIDMVVYSQGRGRMWRQPNVRRKNGTYKVQVTPEELRGVTAQTYAMLVAEPRALIELKQPELCTDLSVEFARAQQKVDEKMKTRGKRRRDPLAKDRAACSSIKMMMSNIGIKDGIGFHPLALQISIAATTAGQTEEEMLADCSILIESHHGDGDRYNTPAKRRAELLRMYRYVSDNPMYDFSVGAIKSLLTHNAPDLDGIPASDEDIKEGIKEAAEEKAAQGTDKTPDEYNDVAGGVSISHFGVYVPDEAGGKRRICAVSFRNIHLLMSTETGQLAAYEAEVLINGKGSGRVTMEMDVFQSLQMFNRFAARFGHAMQGTEAHLRGLFMRFVELAKKKGRQLYIAKREGLDIFNIPNHEDPDLREPFMVWADGKGVVLDPRVRDKDLDISFQGFPDPRGLFKTDLADAPSLKEWVQTPENLMALKATMRNMLTCQKPDVISKMVGWYTACFYRMPFHRAYNKFPILHVNGAAGSGKSLRKGTLVLMADGSTKKIEDVVVGDQLLGPDSGVRNVLALGRGQETMYEVRPVKGDSYYVNESHILSLKRSYKGSCRLSDGTYIPADQEILNVNVKIWSESSAATQKLFKGYRATAVEFHRGQVELPLPPYILGAWLGDGHSEGPTISKPYSKMVQAWQSYAESVGLKVYEYQKNSTDCPAWRIAPVVDDKKRFGNPVRELLRKMNLPRNKHIPDSYKYASVQDRLQLLAGLLDSDGHQTGGGYDWISKDRQMAEDFIFVCRSVGLAAYLKPCQKSIASTGFVGDYFRVSVSGDCERIPCLDKPAPVRRQLKRHLVTGLSFIRLEVEDYYGVVLDSDHLFLLGDFTATHNTEMNKTMAHLFFYNQEPKMLTPQSTVFAIGQHMSGSVSVPLLLDEYKPADMSVDMHNRLKLLIRDAYNARDITKGGGTRESDDYRSLSHTQLVAPLVFIAESPEEEAAVSERIVLITMIKPSSSMSLKWLARYQAWDRNKQHMAILGQYLASEAINTTTIEGLRKEFDELFVAARNKYMLTEADLSKDLDEKTLQDKQGAKERSVFNFTVARFGLMRFKRLMDAIFGPSEFADIFQDLDDAVYNRMSDLQPSTQAEWAKVMDAFAVMTYSLDADSPYALRKNREFEMGVFEGRTVIELSMNSCYLKYRAYMKSTGSRPLYSGVQSFLQSIKDSPALLEYGHGKLLDQPGVYRFDVEELMKLRISEFKG